MVKEYEKCRNYLVSELDKLDLFSCGMLKGAFYAFPKIENGTMNSEKLVEFLFEKARILVIPGSSFGRYGEGYERFVYAQKMEVLHETVARIKQATSQSNRQNIL